MESDELLDFVRKMKTTDHVILFYTNRNEKRNILFTYLKAGLDRGRLRLMSLHRRLRTKLEEL